MSHLKERKEKNCLNCNAQVHGRYCHICGQENLEPKESAWHLITHFFQDITHFDGKFFSTMKLLIFRPGFLSGEYMIGRRNSYLNPVRMYVFTSAVFFLIFFSFLKISDKENVKTTINGKTFAEIEKMDSAKFADFTRRINREDSLPDIPMTREQFSRYKDSTRAKANISFTNAHFRSKAQFDSIANSTHNYNWIERQLIHKQIEINEKYKDHPEQIFNAFIEALLHSLPQMIFISLPLFALLLKMLYFRRKEYYYVNHAIFTVDLYIFIFIVMLVLFGITKLNNQLHMGILSLLTFIISLGLFHYEYKAMRNFYKQRRAKTIFKFILLNIGFFLVLSVLFAIFLFFSFFKI